MENDKQSLRTYIQSLTKKIPLDQRRNRAAMLRERVEQREDFMAAETVLLYRSLDDEIATHDFIMKRYRDKTILLPAIEDDHLLLRQFRGPDTIVVSQRFHLYEASGDAVAYALADLAFIPGVAFDQGGYRLGRGGGYYDRLLSLLQCRTIGICYDHQMVDSVPREEHDRGVDEIMVG